MECLHCGIQAFETTEYSRILKAIKKILAKKMRDYFSSRFIYTEKENYMHRGHPMWGV